MATAAEQATDRTAPDRDPLARPSDLPFRMPPFDRIAADELGAALEAGIREHAAELAAITAEPAPATFANTVEALERSGQRLKRVTKVFDHLLGTDSSPRLRELEAEAAPRRAEHADAVLLDPALFARLDELWRERDDLGLDGERLRVLERHRVDRVRAGAGLDEDGQRRLRALNGEIAGLEAGFRAALLADTTASAVHVADVGRLAGLSRQQVGAAAAAAAERGLTGWLLPLVSPTGQPVLADLHDRSLREQVFHASAGRGSHGGEHDTRAVLAGLAALRAERAGLLGEDSHADWVIGDQTAGRVQAVLDALRPLVPPVVARVAREREVLTAALVADGVAGPLQPWDWAYYTERLAAAGADDSDPADPGDDDRGDDDPDDGTAGRGAAAAGLPEYLELGRVYEHGVLAAANRLYGLSFQPRRDLPTHHPDVRVWEVTDADGAPRGLFLLDPFARESKRGGAWMDTLVDQSRALGTLPVVSNVLNVARPAPGEPALLSLDEVLTAFHEFGHALHGLLSDVEYPSLSCTAVPTDFVEFPSQVNEMWAAEPSLLDAYARHHRTGDPLPDDLRARVREGRTSGSAYGTAEILAATLLDLAWHCLPPGRRVSPDEVDNFERAALAGYGLDLPEIPPRYRSSYFNHVFGGGYAANYYSYLWSEVLDADAEQWFGEHGGMQRANGEVFRREVLSRGGTVDALAAYRAFRGADASTRPLLARLGLS